MRSHFLLFILLLFRFLSTRFKRTRQAPRPVRGTHRGVGRWGGGEVGGWGGNNSDQRDARGVRRG